MPATLLFTVAQTGCPKGPDVSQLIYSEKWVIIFAMDPVYNGVDTCKIPMPATLSCMGAQNVGQKGPTKIVLTYTDT